MIAREFILNFFSAQFSRLFLIDRTFASCLQSIHCPLNIKSYGSLIINLLHLLDIDNCHANDLHSSCSNDKQMIILHDLLTHWTHERLSHSIGYQPDNNNNEHFENYCQCVVMEGKLSPIEDIFSFLVRFRIFNR